MSANGISSVRSRASQGSPLDILWIAVRAYVICVLFVGGVGLEHRGACWVSHSIVAIFLLCKDRKVLFKTTMSYQMKTRGKDTRKHARKMNKDAVQESLSVKSYPYLIRFDPYSL